MAVYLYDPVGKFGDESWQPSILTRPYSKRASEQSVRLSQINHMSPFSLLYKPPLTQLLNFPQDNFFFICSMHSQQFCLSIRIDIRNNWKKWTKVNSHKERFCGQNSSSHQAASWLNNQSDCLYNMKASLLWLCQPKKGWKTDPPAPKTLCNLLAFTLLSTTAMRFAV